MLEILQDVQLLNDKINYFVKPEQKIPIKKKEVEQSKYLCKNMKNINIKAHLINGKYAHFYDYYESHTYTDYFYNYLTNKVGIHMDTLDNYIYYEPFTKEGFKFNAGNNIYYDKKKNECMPNALFGKNVIMTLRIIPYTDEENKKAGMMIKVTKIAEMN